MIQVKAPDGQVLVLKMGASATIGSLHARISRQLGTTAFEIRSAFPHRAYTGKHRWPPGSASGTWHAMECRHEPTRLGL